MVKRLLDTDDESVIQQIKDIFETHEKDSWNELPEQVKAGIECAKADAFLFILRSSVFIYVTNTQVYINTA